MRVVIVSDFAHVNGGAASVAIAGAIGLARRGHGVSFFSAVGPFDARLEKSGVRVLCTEQCEIAKDPRPIRAAVQGVWNRSAARAFAAHLHDLDRRDTIIHLHGWSKALSSSVVRTATEGGFKIACTLHDYFCACPTGGFFDARTASHCHVKPLSMACVTCNCDVRSYRQKLWRVVRQLAQERAGRIPSGIDAFIVLSRLSRLVVQPYLPQTARMFEISNPIDIPLGGPVDVGSNRAFTMIGQLSLVKGGHLFASAARDCGVKAVFVGDGPSAQEITAANPAATITGWVSQERVREYLSKARALVFPSLWYEAQPLVVLEAAARGVPAVVSDGCAAAESVRDGMTGLLFKNGDATSLASALRRLSDDDLVRRLGRGAYETYWADPPVLERHVAELERAYRVVLGRDDDERFARWTLTMESHRPRQGQRG